MRWFRWLTLSSNVSCLNFGTDALKIRALARHPGGACLKAGPYVQSHRAFTGGCDRIAFDFGR